MVLLLQDSLDLKVPELLICSIGLWRIAVGNGDCQRLWTEGSLSIHTMVFPEVIVWKTNLGQGLGREVDE